MSNFGQFEPPKQPPFLDPGPDHRWEQDWEMSDEFEKTPTNIWLRRYRWDSVNDTWLGRAPSFFRKENVVVRDGSMKLWSREDQPPCGYPSIYRDFSTAFVRTKKQRLYGYFEIYCNLMDSNISSAFWFANNDKSLWTELDVFEFSTSLKPNPHGVPFRNLLNTNMHVHKHPSPNIVPYSSPKTYNLGFDLSKSPIKVGFNWQRDSIEWYVNDRLVRVEPNFHFHQPLHLQLDSETFPQWFGLPGTESQNNLPNNFEIFYVRTWYK